MSWRIYFSVGALDLGEGELRLGKGEGLPLGVAYFCPDCGDIWARASIPHRPFHVYTISCEIHDKGWSVSSEVGGSLWLLWNAPFNDALPEAALKRELLLCLKKLLSF